MPAQLREIEAAFLRVRASAEKVARGGESKDAAYEEIFALNNQIGRLARSDPKTMAKMKELQGYVNMITVGMKYDRAADLHEGLAATYKAIQALKKEHATAP